MNQEDMRKELLPCPFCGGEPAFNTITYSKNHVREQGWDQSVFHGVNCIKCGVNNQGLLGWTTQDESAEAWNTRATQAQHDKHKAEIAMLREKLKDVNNVKKLATEFYYWWHNQPGTNTLDGFDDWWAIRNQEKAE